MVFVVVFFEKDFGSLTTTERDIPQAKRRSESGVSAKPRPAKRSRPERLAPLPGTQTEPGYMRVLILAFLITLFIPKQIALALGPVNLTPSLFVSILLFPILILGGKVRWTWPDAVVVVFYVVTTYSILSNTPFALSIEAIGRRVLLGVVPYLVGRYIGSRPELCGRFLRDLMAVLAFFAIFTLLESYFRFNIHAQLWNLPYTPHKEMRLGLTRAYGWTGHPIMFGVTYAIFVPIMLVAWLERVQKLGKYRGTKLGLLMVAVFCSLSTGAWMPAVVAIGLVAWDYCRFIRPGSRWLIMSLGSIGMYCSLELLSGRPLLRILMMELHLSSPQAWHYRWRLYQRVYSVMPGYEWFGHGIKTPAAFANNAFQWSIDNNYLVVLMQYGRVGLTMWIAIPVAVLVYGWRSVWRAQDKPYVRIARAVMFSLVTVGLTQLSVALFSTGATFYWLFMGLAVGMSQALLAGMKRPGKYSRRPNPRRSRNEPQPYPATHPSA